MVITVVKFKYWENQFVYPGLFTLNGINKYRKRIYFVSEKVNILPENLYKAFFPSPCPLS